MSISKVVMFGIPNCDTIKKARRWLNEHNIEFTFHDYRKDGLDKHQLVSWSQQLGWQELLNKRGTTFRQLSEQQKANLDEDAALALLEQYPAMIKRPLLQTDQQLTLGFKAELYQQLFFPDN